LLVYFQAAHSIEEYLGRLWEVFAPARFATALVAPANPVLGFLLINVGVVAVGFVGYWGIVRPGRPAARGWVWFWIVLEGINGLGHALWAVSSASYQPGLLTALLFLGLVAMLLREMLPASPRVGKTSGSGSDRAGSFQDEVG
jgi:hypothetical protein